LKLPRGLSVLAVVVSLLALVMVLSALFEELATSARRRVQRRQEHVPAE
jgi:hypothetical protein